MTVSSIKSAKSKASGRSRRAEPLTPEEKLLRAMFGQDVEVAAPRALAAEGARRVSGTAGAKGAGAGTAAQTVEEGETLDMIGGLMDHLTEEISHLNKELSSSLRRLPEKHKDGVGR
jgi:hypothetical protein